MTLTLSERPRVLVNCNVFQGVNRNKQLYFLSLQHIVGQQHFPELFCVCQQNKEKRQRRGGGGGEGVGVIVSMVIIFSSLVYECVTACRTREREGKKNR